MSDRRSVSDDRKPPTFGNVTISATMATTAAVSMLPMIHMGTGLATPCLPPQTHLTQVGNTQPRQVNG